MKQHEQFTLLGELYASWNSRINLVSRKDLENLYERHVLYSLAIAKLFRFPDGSRILDAGTGGGFPGIPLAIMFPAVSFHLVDSTAKKLKAVTGVVEAAGISNVRVSHVRLEEHRDIYDFVVSRALSSLPRTVEWVMKNIEMTEGNLVRNGLIYLKGGDFDDELGRIDFPFKVYELHTLFEEEFFETKKLVHIIRK